ncbi:MAG: hypothetical protein ACOC9Y_08690 [Chloroflexota bacterium]
MIRDYVEATLVGVLAALGCVGLVLSTSGELQALAPLRFPESLLFPGLTVIGLLASFGLRAFTKVAIAYILIVVLSPSIYTAVLAVPGFDPGNYSVARFNNGLTESVFVLIATGIFVLIGMSIASAVNVYLRNIDI